MAQKKKSPEKKFSIRVPFQVDPERKRLYSMAIEQGGFDSAAEWIRSVLDKEIRRLKLDKQ